MSILQLALRTGLLSKSSAPSFITLYSTISGLTRKKWGVVDKAPSFVEAEVDEKQDVDDPMSRKGRSKLLQMDPKLVRQSMVHRAALKADFPQGWSPPRKLSRETMDALRALNAQDPETFTTPFLADRFRVSPEAVRRILKSKWEPNEKRKARIIERERKSREEWVEQRRMEERQKQLELNRASGVITGKNRRDRLSLR